MKEFRRVRAWLWVAFLVSLVGAASAQVNAPAVVYGTGGGTVTGGAITQHSPSDFQRLISARSNGSANISDRAVVRVGTSPDFEMLLQRPVSKASILKAGAATVARSLPVIATGVALWDLYDQFRVRPDGQGGLSHDPGSPPVPQVGYVYQASGGTQNASTPQGACGSIPPSQGWYVSTWTWVQSAPGYPSQPYGYCRAQDYVCASCNESHGWSYSYLGISRSEGTTTSCPSLAGVSNQVMADGKCRSEAETNPSLRVRVTPDDVAAMADQFPGVDLGGRPAPDVVRDIIDRGTDLAPYVDGPGSLSGPSTAPGPSQTITETPAPTPENPSPAPVTREVATTINITYNSNQWNTTTTTTTTNPDGSTTTTTGDTNVETCGLPGKPACKIDETGTPTAENPDEADARSAWDRLKDIASNPASMLPSLPSINWNFQLPTYCSAIPLPAFAPFLEQIDICPFQPMFHDVMSVVWVIGGLLGAVGLFWRDQGGG